MRQGELLGLRWRDIDFSARRVVVHHTLVRPQGRWWLGEPKTAKTERSVPLIDRGSTYCASTAAHQAERLLASATA